LACHPSTFALRPRWTPFAWLLEGLIHGLSEADVLAAALDVPRTIYAAGFRLSVKVT